MKRSGANDDDDDGINDGGGGINNDSQGDNRALAGRSEFDIIDLVDSSESDHNIAAGAHIDSDDESSSKPLSESMKRAPRGLVKSTQKAKCAKQCKHYKDGGHKRRKNAPSPVFSADSNDPFTASRQSVEFVVRGKPRPQYRDKPGWNLTRYNPSIRYQN